MKRKSRAGKAQSRKSRKRGSMKWFYYTGGVLAFTVLVGLVVGYNSVRSYLRSDEFRLKLGDEVGYELNGDAELSIFEWDGWSVKTDNFSFKELNGFQNIKARGIDAEVDIGAIWSGVYRIENVHLRELEFTGDFRDDPSREILIKERPVEEKSFWDPFLPDSLEVIGIDIASVQGSAKLDNGEWEWQNASAKIRPGSTKDVYDVTLVGGEISTPISLAEKMTLRAAKGRYSGNRFYLLESEFEVLENGLMIAEGDFGIEDGTWQIRGEVTGSRVQEVIAEDWKRRFMGPLDFSFEVTGKPDTDSRLTGHLRIRDGMLTALPLLDKISAYANTSRFRRLSLNEASLDFEKIGEHIKLNNLVLSSEGLVRVEGVMEIEGNEISKGDLRIGITPGTLAHIPGAETKVFQRGDLGLLWTPLKVSGTLDAPQEDLSDRLVAAAKERMFEMLPGIGEYALKFTGKPIGESTKMLLKEKGVILGVAELALGKASDLFNPRGSGNPEKVKGEEAGAIEKGTEAIKKGVGTIFDIFGRPISK
ncbi:hypothetical protein N8491_02595 [Akkermansiaceae bacterium]|nr:hypothetical protein [Akkermansiaceae bacterium]MDA7508445.1 hypothetical protein [Akkermansiaceae bacterium]MDA7650581.1 hypothetical protein [Akkermansiaceae bacterium]MDA7678816.1 hypothetical protein [Akkermansiaceae bacterium]MDA7883118.1 hypothetical protein [Akkermansiaceae bacterium]